MHIMQMVNSLNYVDISRVIKDLEAKKEFVSFCLGNVIAYDEKMCRDTLQIKLEEYRKKGPSSLCSVLRIIERNDPVLYNNFIKEFTSLESDKLLDNDYKNLFVVLSEAKDQLDYLIYTFKRFNNALDSYTKVQILRGLIPRRREGEW